MISWIAENNMGVLRTKKQFVIVIDGKIHGPFKNEQVDTILNLLKQEEK